ncbi:MAG: hypothetical protein Q8L27_02315 [archaeon]|nr:hypothetical protein [archaeon]
MKQRKNSQVRIQEMIFMLIALTIFLSIALLFYLSFSLSGLERDVQATSRQGSILLLSKLASSPEFECPSSEVLRCVDMDKIMALTYHKEYLRFWKVNSLKIERIYPKSEGIIECSAGTYPNCNLITTIPAKSDNYIEDSSYVSLCRQEFAADRPYRVCELGKILIGTEVET